MTSRDVNIRHQVCKTPIIPDNSFSKTHRMIKKETKLIKMSVSCKNRSRLLIVTDSPVKDWCK